MRYNVKPYILILLFIIIAFVGRSQNPYNWDRLDSLVSEGLFATAHTEAEQAWRQARADNDGKASLFAAFYLTNIDYAYDKYPIDSAIVRFSTLTRTLEGADRAVAYTFLLQTYSDVYSRYFSKLLHNQPSDDPNLAYPFWHTQRMEDTLTAIADSILAYADIVRQESRTSYSHLFQNDSLSVPPIDTTLLGALINNILQSVPNKEFYLKLYYRVATFYSNVSADATLWLTMKQLNSTPYDSNSLVIYDSLYAHYRNSDVRNDLKAVLTYRLAISLSSTEQKVKAEQLCLEAERLYPNTYGAVRCASLRQEICQSEYSIFYNNIESSKRNRLAVIKARNTPLLHFRLIYEDSLEKYKTWTRDTLLGVTPVTEWDQTLPNTNDHLMHTYLVTMPTVEQGNYYLIAFTDSTVCYDHYYSADIEFIAYHIPESPRRWTVLSPSSGYVVDRITGMPIKGLRVTLEGRGQINDHTRYRHCRTDKDGYFHFPVSAFIYNLIYFHTLSVNNNGYEYQFNLNSWGDVYTSDKNDNYHERPIQINLVMNDRPVYRLGDTVHFCCEAFHKRFRGSEWKMDVRPAKNLKITATFGQSYKNTRDTLQLKTDKHGRCWGWFVVPSDGENGNYEIELTPSTSKIVRSTEYSTIRVEAYRQPHFTATLSTAKEGIDSVGVHRMGKPITIYGSAVSYSGAPMTGAKVYWEVSREKINNPLQYFFYAKDHPYRDTLLVESDDSFSFTFTPSPSDGDTDSKANYVFTAHATVTDADGESHDCRISLHVSNSDGYCMLSSGDLNNLTYVYNNYDHQPLNGSVHVTVQQLEQPDKLLIYDTLMKKYPDAQWIGSEAEFRKSFPHLAFSREEGDPKFWPTVKTFLDTETTERIISLDNLPSSMYRISFVMPDGSRHDTVVNHVAKGGLVTGNDIVWQRVVSHKPSIFNIINSANIGIINSANIGDTVRFEMGSPYGSQPVYYHIARAGKIYKRGMMILDRNISTLEVPITEEMTEGCVITFAAVCNGRAFSRRYTVNVPRPSRWLNISTETFRDKLQPGQQEHWKLRLTRADSTNAEASLCLTMYDKSLEQYAHLFYGFRSLASYTGGIYTYINPYHTAFCRFYPSSTYFRINSQETEPLLGYSLFNIFDWRLKKALNGTGTLKGRVTDAKTGEGLIGANVVMKQNGRIISGARTDFDGNYTIKAIPIGKYDVEVSYMGYYTVKTEINVKGYGFTIYNEELEKNTGAGLKCVVVKAYKIPTIEIGAPESGARLTAEDIARMPGNSVDEIISQVNGVRKRAGIQVPKEAIAEMPESFNFDGKTDQDILGSASINLRKNLSTLAFFKPDLRSDKDGMVTVDFTLPDALTQWQLSGFAWTDDFAIGNIDRTIQAQKELMVQPQLPRFLRQGDTIELRAKVANLSDSTMTVKVTFDLSDTLSLKHSNISTYQHINIDPHTSGIASMRLAVDTHWHSVIYKISAHGHSSVPGGYDLIDGEQGRLPVLSMKERVTTSRMLYIAGSPDRKEHHRNYTIPIASWDDGDSLSITFTSNPIKYAIDALPHFKKHRMPGNIYLVNKAFIDYLESQVSTGSEKERSRARERAKDGQIKLLKEQHRQGGWSWMPNGRRASLFVTEVVMQRLAQFPRLVNDYYNRDYEKAVEYLDRELVEIYKKDTANEFSTFNSQLSTLFTRSLYIDIKPLYKCDSLTRVAYNNYYNLCRNNLGDAAFLPQSHSLQNLCQLALLMYRMGDTADAVRLATRIKESAHYSDTLGMYWLGSSHGSALRPAERTIENAALAVDVMADILHDWESVNRIQQWILSYRQGTTWRTDMATASAISALIRTPDTANAQSMGNVTLTVNGTAMNDSTQLSSSICQPLDTKASKLNITLKSTSRFPAWGALFYSHNTPVDSVRYDGTGIKLRKTLSVVNHDGSLSVVGDSTVLRVGDRVRLHIDIYCSRDLENMVLRDQRAAGLEPVSTKSGWQYNDGLSYYVDVRDDSFDCYIDRLDEGHYYVEYDLWVRHSGVFASGISSLYSAYAPEFRAIALSLKLNISNN